MLTPAAQLGSVTDGMVNSSVPGRRLPNRIGNTMRMAMTNAPNFR